MHPLPVFAVDPEGYRLGEFSLTFQELVVLLAGPPADGPALVVLGVVAAQLLLGSKLPSADVGGLCWLGEVELRIGALLGLAGLFRGRGIPGRILAGLTASLAGTHGFMGLSAAGGPAEPWSCFVRCH